MDAVVVGGGIAGSSAAYHLADAGVRTRLIDRGDEGRATDAGAGILAPAFGSRTDSEAWFRVATDAVAYYRDLDAALASDDTGFVERPLLEVAVGAADADELDRALDRARDRAERLDTPAPGSLTTLDPARARDLFPPLADVARAVRYDDAAQVDGRRFAAALRTAGERAGLTVEAGDVERIRTADGRVTGVVADGTARSADAVVVAGGAWSGAFADDLGTSLPVEPMRGQIVHLDVAPDDGAATATDDWPILSTTERCYAVPWPGGRVAVGATYEEGSGFVPYPDVRGVRTVLSRAERVAPGLADAALREVRVGLRPGTPDGLPVVGAVPGVEGAFVATGFGPTGLQMGPYAGRLVADLVCGRAPPADLSAFGVERFG
ncbi:MAG: NAD(P)/FAD-dependent oxidoreductase [Haloferacaceae archaeon]